MRATLLRLLALFRQRRLDAELEDDIRAHLELAELDARASGLSPEDARRAARQAFGGLDRIREAHRDARSARLLETIWHDARYGVRAILRTPLVCGTIVFVLAVAIGANATIFSALQGIVLRPLPYRDADRLVVVMHGGQFPVSYANFADWRRQTRSFAAMGAAEYWRANVGLVEGAERVLALRVTEDVLPMLGVQPLHGRLLDHDAFTSGDARQVVIAHGLWQRRFGGDPAALGQSIRLDGDLHSIVGVMPQGFVFAPFWAVDAEVWAPLPAAGRPTNRRHNSLRAFARLAPETTVVQAQSDIDAVTARLETEFPATNRDVRVVPLKERVVGDTRLAVFVFMSGVGFVLVVACANVALMLLARAAARRREVAVRLALGARRSRIVRQLLVESLLLAAAAAAAGAGLAWLGVRALVAWAPPDLPRTGDIRVDTGVLLFVAAVSAAAGLVFGLVPAIQSARSTSVMDLRGGRGASADRAQAVLRDLLLASQVALSLVLLTGAGLMVRTMGSLQSLDPGFDPKGRLALVVSLLGTPHAEPSRRVPFFTNLVAGLGALPGVQAVSAINHLPLAGDIWTLGFAVEGRPALGPGEGHAAAYRVALPDYFGTMGLTLRRGRDFTWQDEVGTPDVAIISENLARRHWRGDDPLGQRIVVGQSPDDPDARWLTIVGIVEDAARDNWAGGVGEEVYLPYLQTRSYLEEHGAAHTYLTMVVRADGDPALLLGPARSAVHAIDRGVAVSEETTLEAVVARALARPRFQLTLLMLCAAVALVLAAAGIYGVVSHGVARRTREIGLRLALGAQRAQVWRQVLGQSFRRVALGVVIGLAGSMILTRLVAGLLHGVRPGDPTTLLMAVVVLAGVALVASGVPAWRASRIEPVVALREE